MVNYDHIISSSLHGIIIAHSYGIPAAWWKPTDRLCGDGSKFRDYALSVDIDLTPEKNINKVRFTLPKKEKITLIQKDLINAIQDHKFLRGM